MVHLKITKMIHVVLCIFYHRKKQCPAESQIKKYFIKSGDPQISYFPWNLTPGTLFLLLKCACIDLLGPSHHPRISLPSSVVRATAFISWVTLLFGLIILSMIGCMGIKSLSWDILEYLRFALSWITVYFSSEYARYFSICFRHVSQCVLVVPSQLCCTSASIYDLYLLGFIGSNL